MPINEPAQGLRKSQIQEVSTIGGRPKHFSIMQINFVFTFSAKHPQFVDYYGSG